MIFNLYKNRGETPLECLERFRATKPELANAPMTYLGRLDPMAEGLLLVGTGEDTEQIAREKYFNLDKDYEFQVLFGFATDTYDILGKIVRTENVENLNELDLLRMANIYEGERDQKYPKFSSKVLSASGYVSGEAESYSNNQALRGEELPSKKVKIYKLQFGKFQGMKSKELFSKLLMDISKVKGDFRQAEILELWKNALFAEEKEHFLANFSASVSSGTYIRSIVNDMGETLGFGACAFSIKRTRVGDFKVEDSLRF